MQMFKNLKKNKKGFTLIELVVVIAILAILAAIAVPRLLGFQDRAKAQADKQSAVQVRNALALLNANSELTFNTTAGTYTITAGTNVVVVGAGITKGPKADPAAAVTVQTMVESLTDPITVVGTRNILLTVTTDGTVTVTSP